MTRYTVTVHAIQTIEILDARDFEDAIKKAEHKIKEQDWDLRDAVVTDSMGQMFSQDYYDDDIQD